MTTAVVATLFAGLAWCFLEGLGRFYPAHRTWIRLRSSHGRRAVRAMRTRLEATARSRVGRRLAYVLGALTVLWVALAETLDKRWYEVLLDALPYAIVSVALLRTPAVIAKIAARMRAYERDAGEDDDERDDGGPTELAL